MNRIGAPFNTIADLCAALKIDPKDFMGCANNMPHHVRWGTVPKRSGGTRIVCKPNDKLKAIQRAIKELFTSYNYPDYIFGLGGDTLRQHAEVHKGENKLVKVDLSDFFPSIGYKKVYAMWVGLGFKSAIARPLTMLTTHDGCLQQGFPPSSHIAAVVALDMTQELHHYSVGNGLAFSQYVDDLNFSGPIIIYKDVFKLVVSAARRSNLSIKRKKTKAYNKQTGKIITGVALHGQRTRAPKQVRQRAIDALKAYQAAPCDKTNQNRVRGYVGFINHLDAQDGQKFKQFIAEK